MPSWFIFVYHSLKRNLAHDWFSVQLCLQNSYMAGSFFTFNTFYETYITMSHLFLIQFVEIQPIYGYFVLAGINFVHPPYFRNSQVLIKRGPPLILFQKDCNCPLLLRPNPPSPCPTTPVYVFSEQNSLFMSFILLDVSNFVYIASRSLMTVVLVSF